MTTKSKRLCTLSLLIVYFLSTSAEAANVVGGPGLESVKASGSVIIEAK